MNSEFILKKYYSNYEGLPALKKNYWTRLTKEIHIQNKNNNNQVIEDYFYFFLDCLKHYIYKYMRYMKLARHENLKKQYITKLLTFKCIKSKLENNI